MIHIYLRWDAVFFYYKHRIKKLVIEDNTERQAKDAKTKDPNNDNKPLKTYIVSQALLAQRSVYFVAAFEPRATFQAAASCDHSTPPATRKEREEGKDTVRISSETN